MSRAQGLSIQHLVARLQKKVEWRGRKLLLTGILPELQMHYLPAKSAMSPSIQPGTVYLGYEIWRAEKLSVGDTIELGERSFRVAKCLEEKGTKDDIRIFGHLHDVQEVLGLSGRINEIEALGCLCGADSLATIRQQLAAALPQTQVTEFHSLAVMRAETRKMMDQYAALIIPVVVLVAIIWVGLVALGNVRERRVEIGTLRALGVQSGPIAALFLGKAVIVGLSGGVLGFALGTWLALHFGPRIFPLTAKSITAMPALLAWSAGGAIALSVIASYLPTVQALVQDPAEVLREE